MNFPMHLPLYQFFHWLVNTPGVGSAFVALAGIGSITTYALTLRWIASARNEGEESLPYPPEH